MDFDCVPVKAYLTRGFAFLSFTTAAIVMLLSKQEIVVQESCTFDARYHDWNGFVYFLIVVCIAGVYNLVVCFIPAGSLVWKTVIVFDVIMCILVGTSLGTGWETYVLIRHGNAYVAWFPLCGTVQYFCSKVLGSLVASSLGFFACIVLLLVTLHYSVDPFLVES